MNYRIVKETVNGETIWALMEYREGVNEPWTCIADDKNRKVLERYQRLLERGQSR